MNDFKVMPNLFRHPYPVMKLFISEKHFVHEILIRQLADRMTLSLLLLPETWNLKPETWNLKPEIKNKFIIK